MPVLDDVTRPPTHSAGLTKRVREVEESELESLMGSHLSVPLDEELRSLADRIRHMHPQDVAKALQTLAARIEPIEQHTPFAICAIVKERLPWLAIFFVGLILTMLVMDRFEEQLHQEVHLAFFVPLLIGHAGNAGTQASASLIQQAARGDMRRAELPAILWRESISAFFMGAFLAAGLSIGLVAYRMPEHVVLVVAVTLIALSVISAVVSSTLPILITTLGCNPANIAPPAITTILDSAGLFVYFLTAQAVFAHHGCLGDGSGHSACHGRHHHHH